MADGHHDAAWNHTAALLCMLAEIHRDQDERTEPFAPHEFHPLHRHDPEPERSFEQREADLETLARALGATGLDP